MNVGTVNYLLWAPHDSPSIGKEGVTLLVGLIDSAQEGRNWIVTGGKEGDILNTGDPLGYLLVLPCTVIKRKTTTHFRHVC